MNHKPNILKVIYLPCFQNGKEKAPPWCCFLFSKMLMRPQTTVSRRGEVSRWLFISDILQRSAADEIFLEVKRHIQFQAVKWPSQGIQTVYVRQQKSLYNGEKLNTTKRQVSMPERGTPSLLQQVTSLSPWGRQTLSQSGFLRGPHTIEMVGHRGSPNMNPNKSCIANVLHSQWQIHYSKQTPGSEKARKNLNHLVARVLNQKPGVLPGVFHPGSMKSVISLVHSEL